MSMPTFPDLLKNPILLLAFGFGSGLAKKAPGTWGTVAAVPLFLVFMLLEPSLPVFIVVTVVMFIAGVWICDQAEKQLGLHDPGNIVWDEIVGYFVTMFMLPVTWQWLLAGFVAFRFFDILKPWPIKWADERCQGGFGVMFDDVIAGIMACSLLHLVWLML
ncbi:MAG: phosphatidylglycerophosphatase A [Methylococcales bacterium]|jgi:phosphatidylglycerophosphatase A|nr:phosphatidylglycerophosphatase A [Methylococcales bacterium]MBT7445946.1 phosphatidylglycerophosphatase A [Methylococcales bacterium]